MLQTYKWLPAESLVPVLQCRHESCSSDFATAEGPLNILILGCHLANKFLATVIINYAELGTITLKKCHEQTSAHGPDPVNHCLLHGPREDSFFNILLNSLL